MGNHVKGKGDLTPFPDAQGACRAEGVSLQLGLSQARHGRFWKVPAAPQGSRDKRENATRSRGEAEELRAKEKLRWGKGGSTSVVCPSLPLQVSSGESLQIDDKKFCLYSF